MNSNYEELMRPTLKHIIVSLSKVKEKNLKSNKRKVTCNIQGRILVDLSAETMQALTIVKKWGQPKCSQTDY